MTFYIGLDDTDNKESRGTGHLARMIAAEIGSELEVLGVSRHQLLVDPRVPYTSHNSSAALIVQAAGEVDVPALLARVRAHMLAAFNPGSDPGLCIALQVPQAVTAFGRRAQREVLTQEEARRLAAEVGIPLLGLGGTQDGVIGALAAVGLAATGEDGRYLLVGRTRELSGLQPISAVLAAGVNAVRTREGQAVTEGLVQCDKLRPARRGGQPVAVVEWGGDYWLPLKLD